MALEGSIRLCVYSLDRLWTELRLWCEVDMPVDHSSSGPSGIKTAKINSKVVWEHSHEKYYVDTQVLMNVCVQGS